MDEGIVALEGVYVVRYFLGGSGCCVAQSKNFKVLREAAFGGIAGLTKASHGGGPVEAFA